MQWKNENASNLFVFLNAILFTCCNTTENTWNLIENENYTLTRNQYVAHWKNILPIHHIR